MDRLIADRDRLIKKLGDEQGMVDRVTKAYEQMIAVERKRTEGAGGAGGAEGVAKQVEGFIKDPLNAAKEAAGGLLERVGMLGGVLAGGAAALAAFAVAGWNAAKSLGEYGLEIENVHLRTGLTTKEVGQFSYAARMAGEDVSIFERMMRGLSEAVNDTSEKNNKARAAMERLGVEMRDATGNLKPTSQILVEISDALAKLPEGVQRDTTAIELFKRAGLEAIPVISKLSENVARAKQLGLGATEEDVRRWEQYHRNVAEAKILWERLVRKIKEPLAATIVFFFKDHTGRAVTLDELKKMGINVAKYEHNDSDFWAAEKQGFHRPDWVANNERAQVLNALRQRHEREMGDEAVSRYYADRQRDPAYRAVRRRKKRSRSWRSPSPASVLKRTCAGTGTQRIA